MAKSHKASHKKRSSKRSQRRSQKRSQRRSQRRSRGGGHEITGAPLSYSLAGDWSSRMSLDQGEDFFKYHANQHGGSAPYPAAVMGDPLPASMVGPSMSTGYLRAIQDVAGLRDAQPTPNIPMPGVSAAPSTAEGGGRRRRRSQKKSKKQQKKSQKKSQKKQQKKQQKGGAALGYQSATAPGLLLPTQSMYNQAGLNPQYYLGTSTETADAIARDQI